MLQVDAVVNPTNESLTDKNPISIRLLEVAGPELKDACKTQIGSESWRHIHTHTGIRTFICVGMYIHYAYVFIVCSQITSPSLSHTTQAVELEKPE